MITMTDADIIRAADLEIDPEDGQITEASSARLKTLFKAHFGNHGVPTGNELPAGLLGEYAHTYVNEFSEAVEEFEGEGAA